jgi:hypothetical protein
MSGQACKSETLAKSSKSSSAITLDQLVSRCQIGAVLWPLQLKISTACQESTALHTDVLIAPAPTFISAFFAKMIH